VLAGAAVRLRPARSEDLDWLVAACGKPSAFGEFEPFFVGEAESLRRRFEQDGLLSEDATRLVVEDRAGRRIWIAGIDDVDLHSRVARITATILEPAERGKGFGTDAHRALVSYLFLELSHPSGVVLLTGTGLVPPDSLTLRPGHVVRIHVPQIGTLVNPVVLAATLV